MKGRVWRGGVRGRVWRGGQGGEAVEGRACLKIPAVSL